MKQASVVAAILLSIFPISIANANSVKSVFDSFSTGAPGVYQTERATHFYGGNITTRIHQPTPQDFVGFTPPSLKAGCGGIDFYAGGFSMISGDEVVQMARGIAQGAAPYFFNLAVSSICPSCNSAMENLSDRLNEINQWAKTSCEQFYDKLDKKTGWAKSAENVRNTESQFLDSSLGLGHWTDSVLRDGNSDDLSATAKSLASANISYSIFNAVVQNSTFTSPQFFSNARSFKETMMSLTGTGVTDNSGTELKATPLPSEVNPVHLMLGNADPDSYTFKRLHCPEPETDDPGCLKVTSVTETMVPLRTAYFKLLSGSDGIFKRLKNKRTMDAPHIAFMQSVRFPYVRLAIDAKSDYSMDDISKYIALEASYRRIESLYSMTEDYLVKAKLIEWDKQNIAKSSIDDYLAQTERNLKALREEYINERTTLETSMAMHKAAVSFAKDTIGNY